MKLSHLLPACVLVASPAVAATINLSTSPTNKDVTWTVAEVSNGQTQSSPPKYVGRIPNGNMKGFTIPFSDNDGFWTATASFTLPAGATNPKLTIVKAGVDDRCLVTLNGELATDLGSTMVGAGRIVLSDQGANQPLTYDFKSGPQNLVIETNFVGGTNTITVFVNNTGRGIHGSPVPMTTGGATNFGLIANVTYTAAQK